MTIDEEFQNLLDIIETAKEACKADRPRVAATLLKSTRSQVALLIKLHLEKHPMLDKLKKP